MAVAAGFDLCPPVSTTNHTEQTTWSHFIQAVLDMYENDPIVKSGTLEIFFDAGDIPRLPLHGPAFRRFSSNWSSSKLGRIRPYLDSIAKLAVQFFGPSRVHIWDEISSYARDGKAYDQDEVHLAYENYLQDFWVAQGRGGVDKYRRSCPQMELFDLSAEQWVDFCQSRVS
ncbi:hypothetical protein DL96DRAFT_1240692 [Flagelloscypha sp. PMI_526]|nr:hypothetical protein DL96DRAFT_1240692 [Flagelloscypha sp. PMI_526]